MTRRSIGAAILMLVLAGCRSGAPASAVPSPKRDVITRDELMSSTLSEHDLYQAILSLRPHFLSPPSGVRPAGANAALAVYVDGIRQAGTATLRNVGSVRVQEVRYLNPVESRNELGVRATGGAIMVRLVKPDKERDPEDAGVSL